MRQPLEYGSRALVGIVTPQANATVEPELGVLMGRDVGIINTRLTCPAPDLRSRLIAYFETIDATLKDFADAPLDAIGVACTGASYILEKPVATFARPWNGPRPVVAAVDAIFAALRVLGARRLCVVSPYSKWLTDACVDYWRQAGFTIALLREPAPVETGYHPIYAQRSGAAASVLADIARLDVDAVVVSGTGLPTLAVLPGLNAAGGPPVLSSNLCLAWALEEILAGRGAAPASPRPWLAKDAAWIERLRLHFPSAMANGVPWRAHEG